MVYTSLKEQRQALKEAQATVERLRALCERLAEALEDARDQIKALCSRDDVPDSVVAALAAWREEKGR